MAHGASAAKLTSLANISKTILEAYSVERLVKEGETLGRQIQAQEQRDRDRHEDIAELGLVRPVEPARAEPKRKEAGRVG